MKRVCFWRFLLSSCVQI